MDRKVPVCSMYNNKGRILIAHVELSTESVFVRIRPFYHIEPRSTSNSLRPCILFTGFTSPFRNISAPTWCSKACNDTSWYLEGLGSLYDCDEGISEGIYVFKRCCDSMAKILLNAMMNIFNNFWILRQIASCRRGYKLACRGGRIQNFDSYGYELCKVLH